MSASTLHLSLACESVLLIWLARNHDLETTLSSSEIESSLNIHYYDCISYILFGEKRQDWKAVRMRSLEPHESQTP